MRYVTGLLTILPVPITSAALFANTFRDFLSHVLLAERAVATIFYRTYADYRSIRINVAWIGLLVIFRFIDHIFIHPPFRLAFAFCQFFSKMARPQL
jgi:uncharacterized membrane protein